MQVDVKDASLYASGLEDENYLRGIAKTNSEGTAWFQTIFPACYSGRRPHIHFEVYASVAKAVSNAPIVKTSQIALPQAVCKKGRPTWSSATTTPSISSRP